jgi:hypothetical protein
MSFFLKTLKQPIFCEGKLRKKFLQHSSIHSFIHSFIHSRMGFFIIIIGFLEMEFSNFLKKLTIPHWNVELARLLLTTSVFSKM